MTSDSTDMSVSTPSSGKRLSPKLTVSIGVAVLAILPMNILATDHHAAAKPSDDIQVEPVESVSGVPGVRLTFTIEAPREAIWQALVDYDNFRQIFRGIKSMSVLDEDEHGATVEFWVDAVLRELYYVLYRRYEQVGRHLTWRRLRGDMRVITGSWDLRATSHPGLTLVVYESYVDVGSGLITWAVRRGAMSRAVEMAERLRAWVLTHEY